MSAVTEAQLRLYAETFVDALTSNADRYLPEEYQQELFHLSQLPAIVTCYVSTQFGVAFEYTPASETSFRTVRGSRRIEDLLLNPPAFLQKARLAIDVRGADTGLYSVSTNRLFPFRLNSAAASLHIHNSEFRARGWTRSIHFAEVFANRNQSEWTEAAAVSRAAGEVLAAAAELSRANRLEVSLAEYIAKHKTRTVLVLGSYDVPGRSRLARISAELVRHEYEPILVEEVPDHPLHNLHQKVTTLGSISRFVIVDDSDPSGHIAELELCRSNNWVTAILRRDGTGSSWMTAGTEIYSRVIHEAAFNPPPLAEAVDGIVEWAESCIGDLSEQLGRTYPWRSKDPA